MKLDIDSITSSDFAKVRENFKKNLVGNEVLNDTSSPYIAYVLKNIEETANDVWKSLNRNEDVFCVFGDEAVAETGDMTRQYQLLRFLAKGYGTYGTKMYKNPELKEDILFALKWLNENLYGDAEITNTGWFDTTGFNWWDWYLGSPTALMEVLLIMGDEVKKEDVEKYVAPYTHFRTTMMLGNEESGDPGHAFARFYSETMSAVLLEDKTLWDRIHKDGAYTLRINQNPTGHGLRKDFMFIHHIKFPYTGVYGVGILISRLIKTMTALSGTKFELDSPDKYNQALAIYNAFDPLMFGGEIMPRVNGRGPAEDPTREIIVGAINLLGCFSEEDDKKLKNFIKSRIDESNLYHLLYGTQVGNGANSMPVYHAAKMMEIYNDSSVPGNEIIGAHIYYLGDIAVQHTKTYGAALSMSSERIGNYESINRNNTDGWYQGDGVLYVYRKKNKFPYQYGREYWKHVNPYRLPGITEDSQTRKKWSIASAYAPKTSFVGGVELEGRYATCVMDFEAYNHYIHESGEDKNHGGMLPYHDCDLKAKKAWFMFENEIVALGCDINSTKNSEVYTMMENKLTALNTDVIVDGGMLDIKAGEQRNFKNPKWIHISEAGGYYLPYGGDFTVNLTAGESNFAEAWLSHGENPKNEKYTYVILPDATPCGTEEYSLKPNIEILENNGEIQAVYNKELNITAIAFWKAGSYGNITVSEPMAVMVRENNNSYVIAASEPSQKKKITTITIDKQLEPETVDNNGKIIGDEKTTIEIDFTDNPGKTFTAGFKIKQY